MEWRFTRWPLALAVGSVLLILPGLAAAPSPAWSMSTPGPASQGESSGFTLEGKIAKVEAGKFTVSTEENIIFHVRYDEKTDIKHQDGTAGSSTEFKAKVRVKVEGDLMESGEIVAKKIEIEQDSKPPASN
jgi:hypothetical protein